MREKLQSVSVADGTRLDPYSWTPPKKLSSVPFVLKPNDLERPDLWCATYLGDSNLLDLVLAFNGVSSLFDLNPGDTINIPDATELQRYILDNRQ